MHLGEKAHLSRLQDFFISISIQNCRIVNIQADVFSFLYSEHNTAASGTLGGILMGRTMETTALFTRMSSSLVLKKAEEFYF